MKTGIRTYYTYSRWGWKNSRNMLMSGKRFVEKEGNRFKSSCSTLQKFESGYINHFKSQKLFKEYMKREITRLSDHSSHFQGEVRLTEEEYLVQYQLDVISLFGFLDLQPWEVENQKVYNVYKYTGMICSPGEESLILNGYRR